MHINQASCKYLPRSCCPTAATVRHKHSTDKHAYRCLFHRALQCRQWDNSCEEDIYMKPDPIYLTPTLVAAATALTCRASSARWQANWTNTLHRGRAP